MSKDAAVASATAAPAPNPHHGVLLLEGCWVRRQTPELVHWCLERPWVEVLPVLLLLVVDFFRDLVVELDPSQIGFEQNQSSLSDVLVSDLKEVFTTV